MTRRSQLRSPERRSAHESTIAEPISRARPLSKLRTITETAEILNTSSRTVRRLIDAGALPVHRFGRLVRVSDADIEALLAANRSV